MTRGPVPTGPVPSPVVPEGPGARGRACRRRGRPALRRARLLAPLLLALAACGFSPALGPAGPGGPAPQALRLAEPATRLDFEYRSAIQDRVGPAAASAPLLTWTLTTEDRVVATTDVEETRRVEIAGAAGWTLTDAAGRALAAGTERAFTSWSATGTTVSVRAAERDAQDRLAAILADRTIARLTLLGAAR